MSEPPAPPEPEPQAAPSGSEGKPGPESGESEPKRKIGIDPDPEPDLSGGLDEHGTPIPRIPRGKGFALTRPEVIRIGIFLTLLIAVVALRKPCGDAIGRFIQTFEPDAGPAPTKDPPGTWITGEMSEEERMEKIQEELGRSSKRRGDTTAPRPGAEKARGKDSRPGADAKPATSTPGEKDSRPGADEKPATNTPGG